MIKKKGNLFDSTAKALGHGVNCRGVMGAGIAKVFRERFPENYRYYRKACEKGYLTPGTVGIYPYQGNQQMVMNIASQNKPGADAQYPWLFNACLDAARRAKRFNIDTVAIPMIGCGIGGLEWPQVETLLLAIEILNPGFQWEVWNFE